MGSAARAFENHRRSSVFQPANQAGEKPQDVTPPYERVHPTQPPSMRLRFQFRNGTSSSYAFSDLREIHHLNAGSIRLDFLAMRPTTITIKGRNLNELAMLVDNAMVRSIEESDDRDVDRLESEPAISSIEVMSYQPPSA